MANRLNNTCEHGVKLFLICQKCEAEKKRTTTTQPSTLPQMIKVTVEELLTMQGRIRNLITELDNLGTELERKVQG